MSNSNHSRGFLPLGVSRKKDTGSGLGLGPGNGSNGFKRPPKLTRPVQSTGKKEAAAKGSADLKKGCDNRLLAGYMAHEYLTKGTLFGQKYDPARAEAAPLAGSKARDKKKEAMAESSTAANGKSIQMHQSYADVSNLLTRDGTHIPGIVNPTQLAQWLRQQI